MYTVFPDRKTTSLSVVGMINSITGVADSVIEQIEVRWVQSEVSPVSTNTVAEGARGRYTNVSRKYWEKNMVSLASGKHYYCDSYG